ncbi:hypothetical protein ABW19_dt0205951 [Dactylella cylindrospora]|nr:hypothetical protein ABW19_dt0205951 [Dactylella cylindrospora]
MATGTISGETKFLDRFKRFKKLKTSSPDPETISRAPIKEVLTVVAPVAAALASPTAPAAPSSGPKPTPKDLLPSSLLASILPPPIPYTSQIFIAPHQLGPTCLPSTRVALRRRIAEWASDPCGPTTFWLTGREGEGKSTIARTIARELGNGKQGAGLGACWLFERNRWYGDNDSVHFVRIIAAQLAGGIPGFAEQLEQAVKNGSEVLERGLEEQFRALVLGPLKRLPEVEEEKAGTTKCWALVIDGIDECQEVEFRTIVRLMFQMRDIKTVSLKIFLTSKPELPNRLRLSKLSIAQRQHLAIVEVPTETTNQDLAVYLRHELSTIGPKFSEDETVSSLAQLVAPSFHDAVTVSRFLADPRWDSEESLNILLKHRSVASQYQIEEAYRSILSHLFIEPEWEKTGRLHQEFRDVVGPIVALLDDMPLSSVSKLLSANTKVTTDRVDGFPSFLTIPTDVSMLSLVYNPSFRKYLVDSRNRGSPFWIDEAAAHQKLANHCLEVLSEPGGLRENICNLPSAGSSRDELDYQALDDSLPEHARYACRYWTLHLKYSNSQISDGDYVDCFLRKHLLHWVEALILLGEVHQVVQKLEILRSIFQVSNRV